MCANCSLMEIKSSTRLCQISEFRVVSSGQPSQNKRANIPHTCQIREHSTHSINQPKYPFKMLEFVLNQNSSGMISTLTSSVLLMSTSTTAQEWVGLLWIWKLAGILQFLQSLHYFVLTDMYLLLSKRCLRNFVLSNLCLGSWVV